MKKTKIDHYTDKEALDFHKDKKPGKIEIISSVKKNRMKQHMIIRVKEI